MCQVWRHYDVITASKLRDNLGFNDGNRKSLLDNLPLVGMYRAYYFNNCVLHSNNFNNSTNERKFDAGLVPKFFGKSRLHFWKRIFCYQYQIGRANVDKQQQLSHLIRTLSLFSVSSLGSGDALNEWIKFTHKKINDMIL